MRKSWREITSESEWRDMLNLTGLTPEQLRAVHGVSFRAEAKPHRARVRAASGPHAVLGLYRDATTQEIKSAYRTLAHKHHPDHGGTVEKMREINAAYDAIVG
jgi:hypothetical protein